MERLLVVVWVWLGIFVVNALVGIGRVAAPLRRAVVTAEQEAGVALDEPVHVRLLAAAVTEHEAGLELHSQAPFSASTEANRS